MRQFIVKTTTGKLDPRTLLSDLWPAPQMARMLRYSVMIHLCLAASLMLFKAFDITFRRMPATVYSVDLVEFQRPAPKPPAKPAKVVAKKPEKPKPKPKPEPKPEPKPKPKKKAEPEPEKKVEVPKVVKPPAPKKKPPEVKAKPPEPKKEPPPPPEPEPIKVAKVEPIPEPEPEPEPVASSSVKLDTDFITPELKWYIEMIRRKVWGNWIEPRHALPPGLRSRVVIRFEINRTGRFALEPTILESSNISALDQSGYRAIVRSTPFPPLPEGYGEDALGVQFGFEYGGGT